MKVAVFGSKQYDRRTLNEANQATGSQHQLTFLEPHLRPSTASLAAGHDIVCIFVNDDCSGPVLQQLKSLGVKGIAIRAAGFNNVNLSVAEELGLPVVRVPAYSPHGVAEHCLAMMLCLNRHIHRAYTRVREGNFSLEGLLGFNMQGKTVGIIGTGKIGTVLAKILQSMEMTVIGYDVFESPEFKTLGCKYVNLNELFAQSDIITLHVPLTKATTHMINAETSVSSSEIVLLVSADF